MNTTPMPKWFTPYRKAYLVELYAKSGGLCVFGHKPCEGKWHTNTTTVCKWGKICSKPVKDGGLCRYNPEEGKPHLPCQTVTVVVKRWHCAYGDYPCYKPFECHCEIYADRLIAYWVGEDRARVKAEWEAEQRELHRTSERTEPLRGQFSAVSRDIWHDSQPQHYIEGLGMSGILLKPFAKVRLASSYMRLHVNLGDTLREASKNRKRKAIRYGKPLPKAIEDKIYSIVRQAVRHFLDH